jgi:hypothetical protein
MQNEATMYLSRQFGILHHRAPSLIYLGFHQILSRVALMSLWAEFEAPADILRGARKLIKKGNAKRVNGRYRPQNIQ